MVARIAFAAFLAVMVGLVFDEAFAQSASPPPERPPGGFAVGGYNNAAKTATATAGAATLASLGGRITTEALSTAAGATYTLAIANARVAAADQCFASIAYGSASAGTPVVSRVTAGSGTLGVVVQNIHASAALNGTLLVNFACFKN